MQTMEDRTVSEEIRRLEERMEERLEVKESVRELRAEFRALRGDIQSMHRTMLCGFFSMACLMFAYAGAQLA